MTGNRGVVQGDPGGAMRNAGRRTVLKGIGVMVLLPVAHHGFAQAA